MSRAKQYYLAWKKPWLTRALENDRVSTHFDILINCPIDDIPSLEFWTPGSQANHTRVWDEPQAWLSLARYESNARWRKGRRRAATGTDSPVSGAQWLILSDGFYVHEESRPKPRKKATPVPTSKTATALSDDTRRTKSGKPATKPRKTSKRVKADPIWGSMSALKMPDNVYSIGPPENETGRPLVPLWERIQLEKKRIERGWEPRPIPLYSDWTQEMVTDAWRTFINPSGDTNHSGVSDRSEPSVEKE